MKTIRQFKQQVQFIALFVVCCTCLTFGSAHAIAQNVIVFQGAAIETMGEQGRLESGQILVEDGIIREVGKTVTIPDNARIIDLRGKTLLPGFIDPYFVVSIPLGGAAAAEPRVITVGGRTFTIPGDAGPSGPIQFVKIADVFDARYGDWDQAVRSGITTSNIVSGSYGQSVLVNPLGRLALENKLESLRVSTSSENASKNEQSPESSKHPLMRNPEGLLYTVVSNDSESLKVLRDGLQDPKAKAEADQAARAAAPEQAGGRRGGGPGRGGPPGDGSGRPATPPAGGAGSTPGTRTAAPSPTQKLWEDVRSGEKKLIVNANSGAAILYLLAEVKKVDKAHLAVVANGADWYETLAGVDNQKVTVVLPPKVDTEPRNQNRVNVPRMLHENKINFVFSLSSAQTEFRTMQANPLFPVAMLVKAGLPREQALQALTIGPAKLLGLEKEIGSVEVGKRADFVVFDGDPMEATSGIEQVWMAGENVYDN